MRSLVATLLCVLTLAATAGAQRTSTHIDYWWSGSAFQVDLLYAQTTRGLSLANRDSKEMVWYASCEHRYPGDPPGGTALHCTSHNGYVLGRIDDENPANADEDCFATMSYRPGYPLPMGATRNSRKVMSIAATAPITKGLGLVVRPGGNPFNDACEAPTFSSPDPGKRYFISIFTGWGSGPRRERWTGSAQPGLGLARLTATFDGELDVGIWSGVPNRSVGEQILVAVKDMLAGWWTSLADGFQSSTTPKIFSPTGGTLDVTATAGARQLESAAAAPTVFSVHQSLRGGASTPLQVRLTSAGRALLRDDSRVPVAALELRFGGASLRAQITPRLLPSIASVQFTGKPSDPTIVVRGRGLAPLPAKDPSGSPVGHDGCPAVSGTYGSDYGLLFNLNDLAKGWSAGAAFAKLHNTSCIGIVPTKVSSSEVDFRLGSFYTRFYPKFSLDAGDQVQLVLNGAVRNVDVRYGTP
ncbi:MAG TPA: hypothetical protein VF063_10095 [Gaiellaceae bacterium]